MLRAQFLDDLSSRGGLVAECAARDAALELVHDLAREPVRIERKRLLKLDASHLPMARGGVLAGRGQSAAPERSGRLRGRRQSFERLDVAESQSAQVGQVQRPAVRDVA